MQGPLLCGSRYAVVPQHSSLATGSPSTILQGSICQTLTVDNADARRLHPSAGTRATATEFTLTFTRRFKPF